jgi:hypothetical protein
VEPEARYPWTQRAAFWLAGQVGARLTRLMFRTCRVELVPPNLDEEHFSEQQPFIGVTWHRSAIFFLFHYGEQHPAIMISRSRDGEYLARFTAAMGGVPVRGSSRHGGMEALIAMANLLKAGEVKYAATVADGPRGPRFVAKPGMILLAMRTGLPLIPLMWSSRRVWVFKKTWDRTMIPKPFARVLVSTGKAFQYPSKMSAEDMEAARLELETELNRIREKLDRLCGFESAP